MAGSFVAMDAEQKRDADGKFSSGGGSINYERTEANNHDVSGHGSKQTYKVHETAGPENYHEHYVEAHSPEHALEQAKGQSKFKHRFGNFALDEAFQPDPTAAAQGEAGRQARKIARDCMSGRFRP